MDGMEKKKIGCDGEGKENIRWDNMEGGRDGEKKKKIRWD